VKLLHTIFDLSQYIEPYPQLEKINDESFNREFKIVNQFFKKPGIQENQKPSNDIKHSIHHIKEFNFSEMNWVFRTYDQPFYILKFYKNKMHRSGWSIINQTPNRIDMKKGKMMLKVFFPKNPNGTFLMYNLRQGY
jgi:hypothetical protein